MISQHFQAAQTQSPKAPFVLCHARNWSYEDFFAYSHELASALARRDEQRLACYLADSAELIALLLAADMAGKTLLLLSHDFAASQVSEMTAEFGVELLFGEAPVPGVTCEQIQPGQLQRGGGPAAGAHATEPAELWLLTTGTTGRPKCVRYHWSELFSQVQASAEPALDQRWLLAYRLNHFAGIQMLVHVIASRASLVIAPGTNVAEAIAAMQEFDVSHVSSTPTFWRFAMNLLQQRRPQLNLRHITLGSEVVTGKLLSSLHELFPQARIVHIYASTESGSCVSVSDLKPGLPASVLSRGEEAAVRFRIEDGELFIASRHGMAGYLGAAGDESCSPGEWRATGDMVRLEEGRIVFLGRRSETINVGGVKVLPVEVETVVQAVDGVRLARVHGQDNPVVGQIVAVEYVVENGSRADQVEEAMREACMELPRHSRPRSYTLVEELETSNFKLVRRGVDKA